MELLSVTYMFLYQYNGNFVGYFSLSVNDDSVELNNLAVLPGYRHLGIGQRLLEDCFEKVLQFGRRTVKIGIVEENVVLRRWYERFGFEHTGTEKYDFFPFTCGYLEKTI